MDEYAHMLRLIQDSWKRLKRWLAEGVWDRVFKELASMRGHDRDSADSLTVEAKRGN